MVSFKGYRSQFDAGTVLNFCLMGLGCPLLLGLSARRLRRCGATHALGNQLNYLGERDHLRVGEIIEN